jgi:hypothetical protein
MKRSNCSNDPTAPASLRLSLPQFAECMGGRSARTYKHQKAAPNRHFGSLQLPSFHLPQRTTSESTLPWSREIKASPLALSAVVLQSLAFWPSAVLQKASEQVAECLRRAAEAAGTRPVA